MKKSISAILVAALMLFAFTACEQQPLIPSSTQVRAITGITGPDYLVGQAFNAADFTVEVEYTDGSKASLNGSGIVKLAEVTFPASAGTYDVIASIGSSSSGSYSGAATATATGTFSVYDISSIEVTTDPSEVSFETGKTLSDADLAGIVITATYGKSKTIELDASEYTLYGVTASTVTTPSSASKAVPSYTDPETDPDADNTALVWVKSKVGGNNYASYEIEITEATADPTVADVVRIASVSLNEANPYVVYGTSLSTVKFDVVGATADGDLVDIESGFTVSGLTTLNRVGYVTIEVSIAGANDGKGVSQVYNNVLNVVDDLNSAPTISARTFTAPAGQDYVLTASDFASAITATKKSDSTAASGFTVTKLSKTLIPSDARTTTVDVTFTWSGNGNVKEYTVDGVSVTVSAPQA